MMTRKDRNRLHRQIESMGFVLIRHKNHRIYRHPVHGPLVMGSSTSDWRSAKNALARAQRMTKEQQT
jgi:hypothetical protein